jgi:anti-sigma-K factor RskA
VYELIPILAGCLTGVLLRHTRSLLRVGAVLAAVAVVAGTIAAAVSGELAESPAFLIWDTWQAAAAGAATYVLARRLTPATER